MQDETEPARRQLLEEINADPGPRAALEAAHGRVWDPAELCAEFAVLGFMAPLVVVARRADNRKGSLAFQASPRYYFGWRPHDPD